MYIQDIYIYIYKPETAETYCDSKLHGCLSGKNPPANAGYAGSFHRLGRYPGEGIGSPLLYPCLGNPSDRGAWQGTVHRVTQESDRT